MLAVPSRFWLLRSSGAVHPASDRESAATVRFERLVDTHLDAIYRTARRLGVRDDDVPDLVQEVLLVIARRLTDIEVDKERAFALGTTARLAANFRRSARRRREALVEEIDAVAGRVDAAAPSSDACGERRVQQAEALALLRTGLDAMTEAQRVTFVLFELEELRASEIAAELGVPEAAVVSRLQRARKVMRRICQRHAAAASASPSAVSEESLP
jgi:RNA polymerase sigma-70 factor (ECF subfamily)